MLGWSVRNAQERIALEAGNEEVRFNNPILPLTRSEMALPLITRGEVIGAISVQSSQANAFSQADISVLRAMADEVETMFYVYVVDEQDHLKGVFSLNNLIFAPPSQLVSDFMAKHLIFVNINDDQETVAQTVAKYDLLAVPVVDEEGRIQGIVTADDALDKIIPTAWKKRLPRMYR